MKSVQQKAPRRGKKNAAVESGGPIIEPGVRVMDTHTDNNIFGRCIAIDAHEVVFIVDGGYEGTNKRPGDLWCCDRGNVALVPGDNSQQHAAPAGDAYESIIELANHIEELYRRVSRAEDQLDAPAEVGSPLKNLKECSTLPLVSGDLERAFGQLWKMAGELRTFIALRKAPEVRAILGALRPPPIPSPAITPAHIPTTAPVFQIVRTNGASINSLATIPEHRVNDLIGLLLTDEDVELAKHYSDAPPRDVRDRQLQQFNATLSEFSAAVSRIYDLAEDADDNILWSDAVAVRQMYRALRLAEAKLFACHESFIKSHGAARAREER